MNLASCNSLHDAVSTLLDTERPYLALRQDNRSEETLKAHLDRVKSNFSGVNDPDTAYELHKSLNAIYDYQINSAAKSSQYDPVVMEIMLELEDAWINFEKTRVPDTAIPDQPKAFARWLKTFLLEHQSSDHYLYRYLSEECSFDEMSFFFSQEVTIDPRFDDLIALMQVGIKNPLIKLELASNFWDEMGNGNEKEIHSVMFSNLYEELDIYKDGETFLDVLERASWQALACGNTLLYSVLHRKNFHKALGALGAVEIISPLRFSRLVKGFKRLGLSDRASEYHILHISIDAKHGNGWLHNAILPTVEEDIEARDEIFFGSMLRLNTSMDYCQYMEKQFINAALSA